jgi:hypothetical protein
MAGVRKRAATKGDVVVEAKPGEEVVSINVGWTVERFVEEEKEVKKRSSPKGKEVRSKKTVAKKVTPKKKPMTKAKPPTKKGASKRALKPAKKKK